MYKEARLYAYDLSKAYNIRYSIACGIIAALSPRVRWEKNKLDADNLIRFLIGDLENEPKFNTYGTMVEKAKAIFHSDGTRKTILKLLNGPKISAFFLNIYESENNSVTVDSWIYLAAHGRYMSVKERPSVKITEFRDISRAIMELSLESGLKPYQVQAIAWLTMKRLTSEITF